MRRTVPVRHSRPPAGPTVPVRSVAERRSPPRAAPRSARSDGAPPRGLGGPLSSALHSILPELGPTIDRHPDPIPGPAAKPRFPPVAESGSDGRTSTRTIDSVARGPASSRPGRLRPGDCRRRPEAASAPRGGSYSERARARRKQGSLSPDVQVRGTAPIVGGRWRCILRMRSVSLVVLVFAAWRTTPPGNLASRTHRTARRGRHAPFRSSAKGKAARNCGEADEAEAGAAAHYHRRHRHRWHPLPGGLAEQPDPRPTALRVVAR